MTGLSPWALETVSQFDVRLCREGIPMRRAWRPIADARGDSFFCHSEARRAEESQHFFRGAV